MLTDFYGNQLTTSTGLARDSYDIGLRAFLSANYGAQEAFSQAIEADPNFALASSNVLPGMGPNVLGNTYTPRLLHQGDNSYEVQVMQDATQDHLT